MKSTIFLFVLVAAIALSAGQKVLDGSSVSDREIEETLNNPKSVKRVVDCVIAFTNTCDPRLKDAYELAPEYFATSGSCKVCTDQTLRRVRKFLVRLQKDHRKEYMRLLNSVTK